MSRSLVLLLLSACAPDVGTMMIDAPDVAAYPTMQPYLEARCATLDCHGDEGRPLRLYAETGLRIDGVARDTPLTSDELEANAWSLFGVDAAQRSDAHLSYLKPLAESEGGMAHVGGDVLALDSDEARCVLGWLSGVTDTTWETGCEAANQRWMVAD